MRRGTQWGLDADPREDWRTRAACLDHDPDLFFSFHEAAQAYEAPRRVCRGCPVRAQCAEAGALERYGMWGGLSPAQRGKLNYRANYTPRVS